MVDPRTYSPNSDPELLAVLETMSDEALHVLMCDCAEHARGLCTPIYKAAGYTYLSSLDPVEVKRKWLLGEVDDDELLDAQREAVSECYWGNPLALGAALLGAAWHPGDGLMLAEDEDYAESMTWYDSALEAACGVLNRALEAVGELHYRAEYSVGPVGAAEARSVALEAEITWMRGRVLNGPALAPEEESDRALPTARSP